MMWLPDGGKKSSILSHFDRKPDGRTDGEMTQADLNASFFLKNTLFGAMPCYVTSLLMSAVAHRVSRTIGVIISRAARQRQFTLTTDFVQSLQQCRPITWLRS